MATVKYHLLFDWGDTLMRVFPDAKGPMCNWDHVELIEGVRPTLNLLKPHFGLHLATNAKDSTQEEITKALARVGLNQLLDQVFCFKKIGEMKPSQPFFQAILQSLHISPDHAIMIGDSLENDILGARRAGLKALLYQPNEVICPDTITNFSHFSKLPQKLERLMGIKILPL